MILLIIIIKNIIRITFTCKYNYYIINELKVSKIIIAFNY